jgi:hypothetical protein
MVGVYEGMRRVGAARQGERSRRGWRGPGESVGAWATGLCLGTTPLLRLLEHWCTIGDGDSPVITSDKAMKVFPPPLYVQLL